MDNTQKVLLSVSVLLFVGLLVFLWQRDQDRTPPDQEQRTQPEEKASTKPSPEVKNSPEPALPEKDEKEETSRKQTPEPAEDEEDKQEQTATALLVETMKEARKTDCPMVAFIYDDSEASRKTRSNLKHPDVQQALGDMHLVEVPFSSVKRDLDVRPPALRVYEPWATNGWRERQTRKQAFSDNTEKQSLSVEFDGRPLEDIISFIRNYTDANILLDPSTKNELSPEERKITHSGDYSSLKEFLDWIEEREKLTYVTQLYSTSKEEETRKIIRVLPHSDPQAGNVDHPEKLSVDNVHLHELAGLERKDKPRESRLDKQVKKTLQEKSFDLNVQSSSLQDLASELQKKTNRKFVLGKELRDNEKKLNNVSITTQNLSAFQTMRLVLEMKDLAYYMSNGSVVITKEIPRKALSLAEILSFLRTHGCKKPNEIPNRKRFEINRHLNQLKQSGEQRQASMQYLRKLDPSNYSILRKRIRSTESDRVRNAIGVVLSTPPISTDEENEESKDPGKEESNQK